jgi:mRNA interferase MazF
VGGFAALERPRPEQASRSIVTRGDIVVAALPGDTGKPRPAIVLRADRFAAHHRVTLLPLTSEVRDEPFLRVDVAPSAGNGLQVASQAMVDRSASVSAGRVGGVIGRLAAADMRSIDQAVLVYLGFAD